MIVEVNPFTGEYHVFNSIYGRSLHAGLRCNPGSYWRSCPARFPGKRTPALDLDFRMITGEIGLGI